MSNPNTTALLADLLKHWAKLEPDRCKMLGEDFRLFYNGVKYGAIVFTELEIPSSYSCSSLASIQSCVQEAIVARNGRYHLENDEAGHHASLMSADGSNYCRSQDKEPAIAILKAYIAWLEKSQEVAA